MHVDKKQVIRQVHWLQNRFVWTKQLCACLVKLIGAFYETWIIVKDIKSKRIFSDIVGHEILGLLV